MCKCVLGILKCSNRTRQDNKESESRSRSRTGKSLSAGNLISWQQHHLFQSKDFNKLPVSRGKYNGEWRLINSQAGLSIQICSRAQCMHINRNSPPRRKSCKQNRNSDAFSYSPKRKTHRNFPSLRLFWINFISYLAGSTLIRRGIRLYLLSDLLDLLKYLLKVY